MENVGDYVKYKIKVKNNSTEDLVVKTSQSTNSSYVKYTILEDNTTLKAGEEKELTLKVEYVTKAEQTVLVNGELEQEIDLTIVAEKKTANPETGDNILIFMIVLIISLISIVITVKTKRKEYLLLLVAAVLVLNIVQALNSSKITIHSKVLLVSNDYVYTANVYNGDIEGYNVVWLNQEFPSTIEKFKTPEEAMNELSEATGEDNPFYLKHKLENNIVKESYVEFIVTEEMAAANPGMNAGTYALRGEALGTYDSNWNFTYNDEYYNSEIDMYVSPYYESNLEVMQEAFGTFWEDDNYCQSDSGYSRCGVSDLSVYVSVDSVSAYTDSSYWYCGVYSDSASVCGLD